LTIKTRSEWKKIVWVEIKLVSERERQQLLLPWFSRFGPKKTTKSSKSCNF